MVQKLGQISDAEALKLAPDFSKWIIEHREEDKRYVKIQDWDALEARWEEAKKGQVVLMYVSPNLEKPCFQPVKFTKVQLGDYGTIRIANDQYSWRVSESIDFAFLV